MSVNKVLLAINGSIHSKAALRFVENGPWCDDAGFLVVSVDERHSGSAYVNAVQAGELVDLAADRLAVRFGAERVKSQVLAGQPADAVLTLSATESPDLLVIGAHAPPDTMEDRLGGTTVDNLVKKFRSSLLVARNSGGEGLRRVLLCLGNDETSECVVDLICKLNWPREVEFMLMHVFHPPMPQSEYAPSAKRELEMFRQAESAARAESVALLNRFAERLKDKLPFNSVNMMNIEDFFVAEDVLEACLRYGADLLVLGPREHTGVEEFFSGSVTKEVLKKANCSVLLVRQSNHGLVSED